RSRSFRRRRFDLGAWPLPWLHCCRGSKGFDAPLTPLEQARRIAGIAQDKLAQDVVILDMRPACSYTDFFILCTGQNPRQTVAIYDEVHRQRKHDERLLPATVDGQREASWIVADSLDVVLHDLPPAPRAA